MAKIQQNSGKICDILEKNSKISAKNSAIFNENFEIRDRCKGVHCVDLGESFPTSIYLQNLAWIQPRTSPPKFAVEHWSIALVHGLRTTRSPHALLAGPPRHHARAAAPHRVLPGPRAVEDFLGHRVRQPERRLGIRRTCPAKSVLTPN